MSGTLSTGSDREGLLALVRATHASDSWVGGLWDSRAQIRHLPSLVVWGMDDPAFPPRFLDRWQSLFSVGRVARMSGVGPLPFEEHAEDTRELVSAFLESIRGQSWRSD